MMERFRRANRNYHPAYTPPLLQTMRLTAILSLFAALGLASASAIPRSSSNEV